MVWKWIWNSHIGVAICLLVGAFLVTGSWWCKLSCGGSLTEPPPVTTMEGWPWYADAYFNLKFQYPPDWKVEKLEVTKYYDASGLGLSGESAAVAGPHTYKSWIVRITPPVEDLQAIHRGSLGVIPSAIIIQQPNHISGNNPFYSDVIRPKHRAYESVLDPYGEYFRFNFEYYYTFSNAVATTSVSFGHSPDGKLVGITAVKELPMDYRFQSYMTMTEQLGHTANNIFVFLGLVSSMQLQVPSLPYAETNYNIPVMPSEYVPPQY